MEYCRERGPAGAEVGWSGKASRSKERRERCGQQGKNVPPPRAGDESTNDR